MIGQAKAPSSLSKAAALFKQAAGGRSHSSPTRGAWKIIQEAHQRARRLGRPVQPSNGTGTVHVLAISPQQGPGGLPNTKAAARPAQSGGYSTGNR